LIKHGEHRAHGEILYKEISDLILDCAFRVHRNLGPGLLESVYEICLAHELAKAGLFFERQKEIPINYDGIEIPAGYRLDLVVQDLVIVELKAIDQLAPIHLAQMMTYLKLSNLRLGLLINFNVKLLKDGIKRVAL
jgi:GxxExxY protein